MARLMQAVSRGSSRLDRPSVSPNSSSRPWVSVAYAAYRRSKSSAPASARGYKAMDERIALKVLVTM
ncbi:hypothetical protein [Streptomyces sp. NBC_01429]|uniref:hypothetical protein n=1 Tax=Streptomyces sp. NBC_01429 TaxID=2903862 RepID=UPI003FCEDBA5